MPYSMRSFTCADCGIPVLRRRPARSEVRCTPCAIEHSAENARQLHARSGPRYEQWAMANARAALHTLSSTGPVEWPSAVLGHIDWDPTGGTSPVGFLFDLHFLLKVGV